jgi:D-3-phosphoglycerate dehydrogenase
MKSVGGKILLTESVHEMLVDGLKEMGFQVDFLPGHDYEYFKSIIHDYTGVITRSRIRFDQALLEKARELKFIGRVGAGMENIDEDYARKNGISCLNSPEGSRDAVGEHTISMLLSLANNLNRADREVRLGFWRREANRGFEIKRRTIGIIGYGNMGSAFAEKLQGFDAEVIAYDKYKSDYSDRFVTEVDMPRIFKDTDVLSLHVPLTDETHYLVDDHYLNQFDKPIILINTARGPVVDTSSLVRAMKSGRVTGAALDVLEYEKYSLDGLETDQMPEPMKYLTAADNVILTPHVAGWTMESQVKLSTVLLDKIKKEFEI